jgi:hypothetical protein
MSHPVAHNPAVDPTLPKVPLKLGRATYHLCFTFAALPLAEAEFRKQGVEVNLLSALDLSSLDATKFVPLLYAGLLTHDPAITPEQAAKLVTLRNYPAIYQAIGEAFVASLAEPEDVPPLDQAAE